MVLWYTENMLEKSALYFALGEKIREARKSNNMTLEALSDKAQLGLQRSSIINIEKGRQQISVHQLLSIADALNLSLDDLFAGLLGEKKEMQKLSAKDKEVVDSV